MVGRFQTTPRVQDSTIQASSIMSEMVLVGKGIGCATVEVSEDSAQRKKTMNKIMFLAVTCLACIAPAANAGGWATDLPSTLTLANGMKRLVLINFTGSDWCPACIKMKNQVFNSPAFQSYADNNLFLVEIDFPRYKTQSPAQQQANQALAEKFGVNAYPTMLLLRGDGTKVAELRRLTSPDDFVPHLKELVETNSPLAVALRARDREASTPLPLFGGAPTAPPPKYTQLTLKSLGGPKNRRLAMINNRTFAPGEMALVKLGDGQVKVRCLEIGDESVVIMIDGKEERQELKLSGSL